MDGLFQEMLGASNVDIDTNVDIVFAIDATESMQPLIDKVKSLTLSFREELEKGLKENRRIIKNLRIKVIVFRDYYVDDKYAMEESQFFILPEEKQEFYNFVSQIKAGGGGDEPESGLEALALALRSDFVKDGDKNRHLIVLFTDAAAHPFEDYDELTAEAAKKGCKPTMYPKNMPKNISEFYNAWEGNAMNQDALGCDGENTKLDADGRRIVLFAPNDYPWCDMEVNLSHVIRKDIEAGQGGSELEMNEVYTLIAYSM